MDFKKLIYISLISTTLAPLSISAMEATRKKTTRPKPSPRRQELIGEKQDEWKRVNEKANVVKTEIKKQQQLLKNLNEKLKEFEDEQYAITKDIDLLQYPFGDYVIEFNQIIKDENPEEKLEVFIKKSVADGLMKHHTSSKLLISAINRQLPNIVKLLLENKVIIPNDILKLIDPCHKFFSDNPETFQIFQLLLEHNANPRSLDRREHILHEILRCDYLAEDSKLKYIQDLIQSGENPNQLNTYGSPLLTEVLSMEMDREVEREFENLIKTKTYDGM